MESFLVAVNAVIPFFCYLALGYTMKIRGVVKEEFLQKLNQMVFRVFYPFMTFYNIYKADAESLPRPLLLIFTGASILIVEALLIVIIPKIVKENPRRGVIIQAIFRSNFVLFGLPLTIAVFGDSAASIAAMMVTVVVSIYNTTSPLAIYVLGGTLQFKAIRKNLKYLVPTLTCKLFILPAIIIAIAYTFGLRGLELFLLIAVYATPVAAASYPMAQNMGGDGELAGQFVVISTAVSMFTLFLWIFFMKSVGLI